MSIRFLITFIYLISINVNSASFDCDQKLSKVEAMICSDQTTSNLDHELSNKYKSKMKFASDKGKLRIKEDQRKWLREERNACENIECIKNSYMIRLYHLNNYSKKSIRHHISYQGRFHNVTEFYSTNDRVSSFNQSGAKNSNNKLSQCEMLIDIPAGTARGNHSYGGFCTNNEETQKVFVCDDEMVGHFKMKPALDVPSINELAIFVLNNCYGG